MKTLCAIRDIFRSISEYEAEFSKKYSLCLNEAMVLCSLKDARLSSGEIASQLQLTCSNTSKLLRSVEEKGLIERDLGDKDKRQMYFTLSQDGVEILKSIEREDIVLPKHLEFILKK